MQGYRQGAEIMKVIICLSIILPSIAAIWFFYRNRVLSDENEFLSERYDELHEENLRLLDEALIQSYQAKLEALAAIPNQTEDYINYG